MCIFCSFVSSIVVGCLLCGWVDGGMDGYLKKGKDQLLFLFPPLSDTSKCFIIQIVQVCWLVGVGEPSHFSPSGEAAGSLSCDVALAFLKNKL